MIFLFNNTSLSLGEKTDIAEDFRDPRRDPLWVVIPITVLYVIIFVSGVVGNVSTCIVIARNKHMHTATNYYLFSLAVSDLLQLLSGLPQEIVHIWSNYPYLFGEVFCVLTGYALETSANATVLTITAFTVERYLAICHPFLSHTVSKLSRAVKLIIAIWIFSLCLAVPQAIQMGLVYLRDENGNIVSYEYSSCTLKHSIVLYSFFVSTLLFFLTPMTLISVLYVLIAVRLQRSSQPRRATLLHRDSHIVLRGSTRGPHHSKSTKRVVKMLVAVVVAFFICWAPFQVQRLYAIYGFSTEETTATEILVYKVMTYASGLLYYLSTTINPILYNIMSLKFRQAFKSSLARCVRRERLRRAGELGSSVGGRVARRHHSSSGHSSVEPGTDLSQRPLVVSFRRRSTLTTAGSLHRSGTSGNQTSSPRPCVRLTAALTSSESLPPSLSGSAPQPGPSPLTVTNSPPSVLRHTLSHEPNESSLQATFLPNHSSPLTTLSVSPLTIPSPHLTPSSQPLEPLPQPTHLIPKISAALISRVEDIEIFQECQLRIQRSVRRHENSGSCSAIRKSTTDGGDHVQPLRHVHKSFTVPCLVLH